MPKEFEDITIKYMEETDIDYRKSKGQYFTPKSIREQLLGRLPNKIKKPKVLDPGCGTGEFLISAKNYFKNPELYGWDVDSRLVKLAKKLVPYAKFKVTDALKEEITEYYDFVIGNPPYYEFSPDKTIKEKFKNIINGRVNIFSLFIQLGLDLLKDDGCLAYVLPPSMNNGAYFSKLRKFIINNSNIEYLKILDDTSLFHKALQMTMLLVLRKGKNKGDYLFEKNGIQIFSEKSEYLKRAFEGKACLYDLGFRVKTGRLVWNQNKEFLTNNPEESIPLIWAHNITKKGLRFPMEHKKPQYVKVKDWDIGPAIVVNRITGAAKSAKLKAAIIPEKMKFIGENHVNVIFPPKREEQGDLFLTTERQGKRITLEDVLMQLRSEEKLKIIRRITGNTQVSKTELEKLFPIDIV